MMLPVSYNLAKPISPSLSTLFQAPHTLGSSQNLNSLENYFSKHTILSPQKRDDLHVGLPITLCILQRLPQILQLPFLKPYITSAVKK